MPRYVIIEQGVVTNAAIASSPIYDNWVQSDTAAIGDSYANGVFTSAVAPVVTPSHVMKSSAFWERFTQAELVAYEVACQHNPADAAPNQSRSAKLRIFRRDVDADKFFDVLQAKRANKVTGLLVTEAILTAPRATSILTDPLASDEVYRG
jgi:hypothetical protein